MFEDIIDYHDRHGVKPEGSAPCVSFLSSFKVPPLLSGMELRKSKQIATLRKILTERML